MSEWHATTLGQFVSLQRGHDLTDPQRKAGAVPVMGSAGQNGFHDTALAKGPGVVIGRSGASFGQVHYSERDYWPHNTCLYVTDFHGNDPRFAYYFLQNIDFAGYNSGSAQPSLNRNFIHPIEIRVPSPTVQREIARVLGALDDKIELNRRMNETLESMARAIFQSWFVDFDPVRAKANGEDAESICQRLGLPRDILDMFPDSFAESELGSIPAGWAVTTLRSMTSKIGSGATPRGGREVYLDEGVSFIRSQNVYDSDFVWDGLAHITDDAAKQLGGVEVKASDVLINITGASILRTCVVDPHVLPARVNQHVAIVRAKSPHASRYLHLHLLEPETKSYLMGLNAGASREAVTKGHLESVPIIDPGSSLLQRFAVTVAPLYAMCETLSQEARNLQCLRDALLPKLLSGELEPQSQLPGIADERGMILSADAGGYSTKGHRE